MSTADAEVTSPLAQRLCERIAHEGALRIDEYMQACLSDPQHGYWQKGDTIGADGDFTTAPEISQVFGELIGLWCALVWQNLGQPKPLRLVELGPGRGTLMRDALRAIGKAAPQLDSALTLHLVEASGAMREAQRRMLASVQAPITWHAVLGEVPQGTAIIIANEFLDALPIRQLICSEAGWRERVVGLDLEGALCFALGPETACSQGPAAQPGTIVEVRIAEDGLVREMAERTAPLAALFVDYGPAEAASGDTLQAVRRHRYVDPLAAPGVADLTAHVQFASLARKASAAGFACDGPITQAEFLARLGITERAARLMSVNPDKAAAIEAGVQRLLSPTGMGTLFKALALRSPELPPLPAFG